MYVEKKIPWDYQVYQVPKKIPWEYQVYQRTENPDDKILSHHGINVNLRGHLQIFRPRQSQKAWNQI